jgi:hypothetical protein
MKLGCIVDQNKVESATETEIDEKESFLRCSEPSLYIHNYDEI